MKTLAPTSRVDAIRHLAMLADLAASLVEPGMDADADAIRRQFRCDLHALGVTSDELDRAGA
ncbi:MAG: hypothetical protein ACTHMS_23435 [Jatrophihabitans sp.]|uniref:hypothetical protein n=1 Tax=Jatrophihabitans sp. TaxID=1932789 RepID=UPI003F80E905